jgi:hypothetical protein
MTVTPSATPNTNHGGARRMALRAIVAYATVSSLLFLVQAAAPSLFAGVPRRVLDLVGFVGMLAPLVLGCVEALAVVRGLERGNRARPAWMLLAGWLGAFAVGEATLGVTKYVLDLPAVTPSPGDAFFLAGYAMLICAAVWFVRVTLTSGFPVATPREPWVITLGATAALTAAAWVILRPIAHAPRPAAEAIVAVAYPVLDFVVLVPTALLVVLTARFRGGRLWVVWALILSGFVVLSVADVLFAYFDLAGIAWLEPLLGTTFIAGYTLTAAGAAAQRRLMAD